jgi:hypothetical protein
MSHEPDDVLPNMSHDPDHVLPPENYNLSEFIQEFTRLNDTGDTLDTTIRSTDFALTGRHPDRRTQAVINPLINRMPIHASPTIRRDYDSLIGFTDDIPIVSPLNVYPVARIEDTLTSNIHIKVPFPVFDGRVCTSI